MRDSTGLDHVQARLVWRKAEPVGAEHIVSHNAGLPGLTVETVDMLPHFRGGFIAFVIPQKAEDRIRKPEGAVGFDHPVIGRVEAVALPGVPEEEAGSTAQCCGMMRGT